MRPSLPEDCEKRTLELDRYGHGEILCRPRFSQAARAGRGDVLAKTKCRAVLCLEDDARENKHVHRRVRQGRAESFLVCRHTVGNDKPCYCLPLP